MGTLARPAEDLSQSDCSCWTGVQDPQHTLQSCPLPMCLKGCAHNHLGLTWTTEKLWESTGGEKWSPVHQEHQHPDLCHAQGRRNADKDGIMPQSRNPISQPLTRLRLCTQGPAGKADIQDVTGTMAIRAMEWSRVSMGIFFSNWHSFSDQKPSHWPVLPKTSWSVIKIRWNINTINWKQTWSSRRQSWITASGMCRDKLQCRCDSNSRQHWRQRRGEIWAQNVTGLLGQLPCLFTGQEQNLPVKNGSYLSSRNPVKTEMFTSQSQCYKSEITTLTFLSLKTLVTTVIILTVTLRRWK